MIKFKKVFRIISVLIAYTFILSTSVYAINLSNDILRKPLSFSQNGDHRLSNANILASNQDIFDKLVKYNNKLSPHRDKFDTLITYFAPEKFSVAFSNNPWGVANSLESIFNKWDEYKFKTFTAQITPEKFSIAFSNNPWGVANSLGIIFSKWFNNWDEYKFKTFTAQITPEKFSIAFSNNPEAVADSLRIIFIFNNWDKFKTFSTQITPEKFSIAFSNNPRRVANSLESIFNNWDEYKFKTFSTQITPEKFSIAFSNNPEAVSDSLRIIFNNWDEYQKLAEGFIDRFNFLDSYAKANNIEEQSTTFSVIKSLELLRFFKDLSLKGKEELASEILQKEGLKGLFLMLKFFYEFRPMFFNDRDGFIEYFLGKNKLEIEPRHYIFRFGRNLLHIEIDRLTGERTYVITKIFGNNNAARKELSGLKILSQAFGALKDPIINTETHTITYRVNEPGIFIMPTEVLVFASKEEIKALYQSLIEKTLQQIYTLAKDGYVHTSLTAISHGKGDNGQSIGWVAYRGGAINDLNGLNHVNFRPGIGMVDAEHIFNDFEADIGLHTLDPRILKIDIGGSSFEVTLGIIYGAIKNGLTVDDILSVFNSIKLNVYSLEGRQEEVNIFKGSEDKIRNLYYDVLRGRVNHQRNTDGFLVWLENNLPDVNKVKTEGNAIILPPVSGNYLKNPGGILLINQSL